MKWITAGVLLFAIACQNQPGKSNNAATATPTTSEDSLYKEIIALHDEAMPKMGKLIGYQKTIQVKIDSLTKSLAAKKDAGAAALKADYENLAKRLANAQTGMNNWMDSFNYDPKFPSKGELIEYYQKEKIKAGKMRDEVFEAIDSAAVKIK